MKTIKTIQIFFLSMVLVYSCTNRQKQTIEIDASSSTVSSAINEQKEEVFENFFAKFQKDSTFQISRIKFPVTYYIYESGSYMDNLGNVVELHDREIIINRGSWEYQNFKMFGIKIISEISKSEYKVELQIDDTGVSVNYFFEIDNDKWYLIKIVDESM